jgi:hypothetical protein
MTAGLDRILDAHGGLDYWNSLTSIDLEMSAHGFLFAAKHVPRQHRVHLTISTRKPEAVLHDYPAAGQRTVLHGAQRVEVRDGDGTVLQTRTNPRDAFRFGRRSLYWDALDFAYFSGYAMWNYTNLPFLLSDPRFSVETLPGADGVTRLRVGFPPGLPTHCGTQEFFFDTSGRLTRHDYTAEVVGSWAKAAHLCENYRQFGGLWLPTRRRVYPRGPLGRPLPLPTLVAIDVHDAQPQSD